MGDCHYTNSYTTHSELSSVANKSSVLETEILKEFGS